MEQIQEIARPVVMLWNYWSPKFQIVDYEGMGYGLEFNKG